MNKPLNELVHRSIEASILAFLFWLGTAVMHWPWLVFLSLAALIYAAVCLIAAVVLWRNNR